MYSATAPGHKPGKLIRVKPGIKGFLEGHRFVTPADPPFVVADRRANQLVEQGLALPCSEVDPELCRAVANAPRVAERAVARNARPQPA